MKSLLCLSSRLANLSDLEQSEHVALTLLALFLFHPLVLGLLGQCHELGHHPGLVLNIEADAGGRGLSRNVEEVVLECGQSDGGVGLI